MLSRIAKNTIRLLSYEFAVSGKHLPVKDLKSSDPFFKFSLNNGTVLHQSEVVKSNLNPTFKKFTLDGSSIGTDINNSSIKIEVRDKDMMSTEYMGSGFVKFEELENGHTQTVRLIDIETKKPAGTFFVKMTKVNYNIV